MRHNTRHHARSSSRNDRAFSLVELLVVMGVMIALVATTLPAFRALQESNRSSNGVNGVSAALSTARALAVREGRDSALMFMFDVTRQVTTMQLLVLDSTVDDMTGKASVFVPAEGQSLIELPQGAGVFGYGYGATRMGDGNPTPETWYEDLGEWYETEEDPDLDPWLFPRTDPRIDLDGNADIQDADLELLDTFIIRFSPEGTVVTNAEELGSGTLSGANGGNGFIDIRIPGDSDFGGHYRKWSPDITDVNGKDEPLAECHLRCVPFLAVVDLYKLSAETGIRKPWLALGEYFSLGEERYDSDGDGERDHIEIDFWIDTKGSILSFNRYTGAVMKDIRR